MRETTFYGAVVALGLALAPPAVADPDFIAQALPFVLTEDAVPPPDPSNRWQGNPVAEALGRSLFLDPRLSRSGELSCASCHVTGGRLVPNESRPADADRQFRTVMPVAGAAFQDFFFWDGRKDSLWSQALAPLETPSEHGLTRTEVAARLVRWHGNEVAALTGAALPSVEDLEALPPASPVGTRAERRAWRALDPAARARVTELFVLTGKLIAAFEAGLPPPRSAWDRILTAAQRDASVLAALPAPARRGFDLFTGRARCATCHLGPLFTDGDFHNTGLSDPRGGPPDPGRQAALMELLGDEFNCLGPWSDAAPGACPGLRYISLSMERALGTFRTPSLRGVSERSPLMHAGQFENLRAALHHYNRAPPGPHGRLIGKDTLSELLPLGLTQAELADLEAFLDLL